MRKKNNIFFWTFFYLVGIANFSLYSLELNKLTVPDSSLCRKELVDSWFEQDYEVLKNKATEFVVNDLGQKFAVRFEELDSEMAIIVAPEVYQPVNVIDQDYSSIQMLPTFPSEACGSWILFRDKITGKPLRIRYYFMNDSEVYVQFKPEGKKSSADFYIFGSYTANSVSLSIPLSAFYSLSFSSVKQLTEYVLPWKYIDINEEMYRSTYSMATIIKRILEENQLPSDLDNLHFLKWIVDGIVVPLAGNPLKEEVLKTPTISLVQGSLADFLSHDYSVYKSYDWIRNLAAATISVTSGVDYETNKAGIDVSLEPFSFYENENDFLERVGYVPNSGYPCHILKPLLYILSVVEPDRFFLGAIRQTDMNQKTEIHYYNKAVAFLPYFDEANKFCVSVFLDGREISLEKFLEEYNDTFVYLVRIKSSDRFYPERKLDNE